MNEENKEDFGWGPEILAYIVCGLAFLGVIWVTWVAMITFGYFSHPKEEVGEADEVGKACYPEWWFNDANKKIIGSYTNCSTKEESDKTLQDAYAEKDEYRRLHLEWCAKSPPSTFEEYKECERSKDLTVAETPEMCAGRYYVNAEGATTPEGRAKGYQATLEKCRRGELPAKDLTE